MAQKRRARTKDKKRTPAKAQAVSRSRSSHILARFDEGQRYACRDCPARCCRLPWRVRLEDEEVRRLAGDRWVEQRLGSAGLTILERGVVPILERDRRPACVFLEDDDLCGPQCTSAPGGGRRRTRAQRV